MKTLRALALLLLWGLAVQGASYTAQQLIAKVLEAQETTGFRARARLVRTAPGQKGQEVTQLLIKGRREGGETWVLYQALWPEARRGQALVLHRTAQGAVTGFFFEPPAKELPLTDERMRQPLFGSDLTPEDLAEEFWRWPSQKIVGGEPLGDRPCAILESRPAAGAATRLSRVKSWVAAEIALPLRVEKYGRDGKLEKRFEADRVMKRPEGGWTAATITITPAAGGRTVLEGTKSERGLTLPAEQFTAAGLAKALPKGADQGP